ncbi:hypothetical protein HMEPL2_18540 [Vreelandella aquamarina]|mgnify:CR=1 FL=1|uniref:Uncharacterized protein n=1 Tax=Vreelandella aquamarina TaxID=77097 RepID=A0A6F8XDQ5_9GAMM|nr:hypothetical protein [Halomonas meridiana]BCB71503.1 hypothetical protein HMEPL2_18540 [Halomonas meridiana]
MSSLKVVVETNGKGISSYELVEFLRYFRAAYVASLKNIKKYEYQVANLKDVDIIKMANIFKLSHVSDSVDSLIAVDCGDSELELIDIKRENPLSFTFSGSGLKVAVALTVVAWLCGAEVSVSEIEAGPFKAESVEIKLPSLADGISRFDFIFHENSTQRTKLDDN